MSFQGQKSITKARKPHYSEIFLINYLTIPFFEFRMPHLRVTEFYQHGLFTYGDNVDRLGDPLPGKLI